MEIIKSIAQMKDKIKEIKGKNLTIGFVPTMGYLHDGHRSLIERARIENDVVVVSVFVNPTQFGPNEDFEKYPRDEKRDADICADSGCDILFMPETSEMYQGNHSTFVEVFGLTDRLCGASRPGHFRGVCTIVTKLFNIVKPDRAYFGQKDAQQLAVIRRMANDLNMDIDIIGCPIIRENDGLALSSRNTYLSDNERKQAVVLYKALQRAKELISEGEYDVNTIKNEMYRVIKASEAARIDYIEVVDNVNLKPVERISGETLIALAVKIGNTRLIDNMVVKI